MFDQESDLAYLGQIAEFRYRCDGGICHYCPYDLRDGLCY